MKFTPENHAGIVSNCRSFLEKICSAKPVRALGIAAIAGAIALVSGHRASAQNVIQSGSGSFADSVPVADQQNDSYYGLPANQVSQFYSLLHKDPSLNGLPIPTNHWWTDMLVGNRSYLPSGTGVTQYVLQQDLYGGNMWVVPSMVNPESYGLQIYYANAWKAANANGSPQGSINPGVALPVHGDVPYHIPAADVLIADFENGYPTGTTISGTGFAATPSTGSGLTNMLGKHCANTRDGGNGAQGTLTLPSFVVSKHYLNFLICGGTTSSTQVQLVVGGTVVLTAQGVNSTAFNWVSWDLTPYTGQTATVQVVDSSTASWGFIACDQIVESDSNQMPGRFGGDMVATNTVVTNWGDWNVDFKLPDAYGNEVDVTMARGVPFTWTRWTGMNPKILLGGTTTFYDTSNNPISTGTGTFTASAMAFTFNGKPYGIFLPDNTTCTLSGTGTATYLEPSLSGTNNYMVVGYLPATTNLAEFNAVAFARPTNTQMNWTYDPVGGKVVTNWAITTTPMKGTNLNTIQGWLPHHYRTTTNNFSFSSYTYLTQRGTMKCATGNSFQITYPFKGVAPILPAPVATGTANDFQPARMTSYLHGFNPGTMLGETYGSGKALSLCAQYMAQANQVGDSADFTRLEGNLRTAMVNWMTYTPGETQGFFANYSNWGAMVGFDVSYGSQAFNDMHFHYGYFAISAALLGMYDKQFLASYGPMMTLVVKDFANYDRSDTSEPFMRMFDIWEGHSNAGGLSSPNGENQESSSEAMNSWAGVFLLGNMMNNSSMAATGAMGFAMEGATVNEYWEDLYNTNFPSVFGRAWCGQVWGDSIVYGNYFTADPLWDYAIQMVPSNHWNNYLVRDQAATAATKLAAMWTERSAWAAAFPAWSGTATYANGTWVNYNSSVYYSGTAVPPAQPTPDVNTADWIFVADTSSSTPDIMGGYPGDYLLAYQALWDHDTTAAMFDTYYTAGKDIATNATWAGSTYYLIHAMRLIGDQDFTSNTSVPTSAVYVNSTTGVRSYVVYNTQPTTQTVTVYNGGVASGTMTLAGYSNVGTTNANYTATAPAAPTGLTASATVGAGTAILNWNPSAIAASYNVKRSTVSGGPYTTLGSVPSPGYTDSAVTVGSTYYYAVSAVNSIGEGANSSQTSVTIPVPPLAAINCGGTAAPTPFVADTDFTGGSTSSVTTAIDLSAVTSPAPMAVYQTCRTGTCTYTIPGMTAGTNYTVRLHFSENFWTAAGKRTFNVIINGTNVLPAFDIFAAAGAKNKANIQQFTVAANGSGQIVIQLTKITDNPQINGIEIPALSIPPVIGSSLTATGTNGTAFNYQITASNSPTSYGASGLPTGLSVNTSTGLISGTATVTGSSSVTISAVNSSGTGSATLALTVLPPPPVVSGTLAATGTNGSAFSYQITASNSPTSYGASGLPTGLSVNTATGLISGTATVTGISSVTINATNAGGTGSAALALTIQPPPPVINSTLTTTGTNGLPFSYQIGATNSPTSYSASGLPTGLSVNTAVGTISGTPTVTGTSSITINATNGGGTGTATLVLTVLPPLPVVNSALTATGTNGSAFSYQIAATNSPTSYGASGLPTGLSVNTSTGAITGTPTATGTSSVTISAANAGGSGSATLTLTVLVTPPTINSALTATGTNGSTFSYQIAATNSPTSYGASGLPTGLSVDTAAGTITGTPTTTGTSSVTINATNAGGTGSATLTLTVQPPAPVINSSLTATGTNGSAFSYQITATNSPTSFSASGLPTGLAVNTSTGAITGTPSVTGTSSVTIGASNTGGAGSATLTITVTAPVLRPAITSGTTATGNVGSAFSYQITASNSPASYNATGLPAGLTVSTSTGLISGTATTTGTTTTTISAVNTSGTGTSPLKISITASTVPVVTSGSTASTIVGAPFSYQITATHTPTSYAASGLPTGLSVNTANGLISGTATTTGTATATISAVNTSGTGTASLVITTTSSTDTNVGLSKSATASSVQAGNAIASADDGSATTRWAASDATYPQWWRVDLGANKTLSRLDTNWYSSVSRSYKYKIEVSTDDITYTTAVDKTSNTALGDTSDSFIATARYVRITLTGGSDVGGFASAYEFKVFGH